MRFLLYITIFLSFFGSAFFLIDLGWVNLFPVRICIMLLCVLFIFSLLIHEGKLKVGHIRIKPYIVFLFVWLFYAVLSLAWADSPSDVVRHVIYLFTGFLLIFFVVMYFKNPKDYRYFVYTWLIALVPLLLLGLWNYTTGNFPGNVLPSLVNYDGFYAPKGVFTNINDYATYLALTLPFILVIMSKFRSRWTYIFGVPLLLISIFLLIQTTSRANYLAVIIGLIFWLIFFVRFNGKIKAICITILLLLTINIYSDGGIV